MDSQSFDVIVIGGGAAGLSAALVLGRARRRVVVVDSGEPRNAAAAHMQGYLSRDGMPPSDLLAAGRDEVAGYGVEVTDGAVVSAVSTAGGVVARLADGRELTGRRVLVTAGMVDEVPEIAGVSERWGKDLLHCPYCHGWEVRDRPLGVFASEPVSLPYAHLVRQWSDDVVFFARTHSLTMAERTELEARDIRVVEGEVARLVVEGDRLTGVEMLDGRIIARSAVFVKPLNRPHAGGLLDQLGCSFAEDGFVIADGVGRAGAKVWVAGNVVDPRAQVITAAGQGSAAAIAINGDLVREDVERAIGRTAS